MKFSFGNTLRWSTMIAVITLVLAAIFSIISTLVLSGAATAMGMMIVFLIILVGVIFDTVGLAAAAADEVPFHAMASERVRGAKQAIRICRNADRFSSFCNDVIGDISGIVSGTASSIVVLQLVMHMGSAEDSGLHFVLSVVFTSVVAALTVGGKAIGKSIAIHFSTAIILFVGKIFYQLEHKLHVKLFLGSKHKRNKSEPIQKKKE